MTKRFIFILAFLLVPLGAARGALDVEFGRYHALVIGINDYQNIPNLNTAVNDASAVADMLRQRYGFEVELLLNPTRDKVIRTLDRLRGELTERDNLLIYFAGHGILDVETDTGFWLPVDAEEDTHANWIAITTVTRTTRAISAKHVMVVADSCYSGTLTRGVAVSIKTGSERAVELERLAGKRSRTALVSGGLEPVADGGGDGHSVFARAFLTALGENREIMDGQQLFTKIRRPVVVRANQTPEYSDMRLANHEGGDFLFVPARLEQIATAARETEQTGAAASNFDARELELAFWNSVKDRDRAADFEAYLDQYPSGVYAALARIRIEQSSEEPAPEPAAMAPVESNDSELAFWGSVEENPSAAAYTAYIDQFPDGAFTMLARLRLQELETAAAPVALSEPSGPLDGVWTGWWRAPGCSQVRFELRIDGGSVSGVSYTYGEGMTELKWPDPRQKNVAELAPDGTLEIRTKRITLKGRLDAGTGKGGGRYREVDWPQCNRDFQLSRK